MPLSAVYSQFEVDGIAIGVMGYSVAERLEMPYLVVETKRGVENQNPIFQLYAQLLEEARLNWEGDPLQDSKVNVRLCRRFLGVIILWIVGRL